MLLMQGTLKKVRRPRHPGGPPGKRQLRHLLIPAIAMLLLFPPTPTLARDWSEGRLDKALLKIDREMDRLRWDRVIKEGSKALPQCIRLKTERAPACISLLTKINHSLYHTGYFLDNREQIEKAYFLSVEVFGKEHYTTGMSRNLYYRLLLSEGRFLPAIDIVQDIIDVEKSRNNDPFEILERTRQLYALYGLTGQYSREEETLRALLAMTDELLGADSDEHQETVRALAENLCFQKKYFEFFEFVNERGMEMECRVED